jgi:hypothetical protein
MNSNPFDIAENKYSSRNIPKQQFDEYETNLKNEEKELSPFDIAQSRLKGEPIVENEFDLEREIERNQAQLTSRALEGIIGLPFDIINLVGNAFGYDLNTPGSEKLKEFSEAATMGYTAPRNEFEQEMGDLFKDVALFALPGAKHYSLARNLGIPVAAELAKEGIKSSGGKEGSQILGKLGTSVFLDVLSHRRGLGTSKEISSALFEKADKMVPKGVFPKADDAKNSLTKLLDSLKKGGTRPDTDLPIQKTEELLELFRPDGKVDLKKALAFRPAINAWIDKFKGFEVQGIDDANRRRIINNLQNVKKEVIKLGQDYGKKFNPEFLKTSNEANQSWAAWSQSNKIANFIEKKASSKIKSAGLKAMLGLGITGSISGAGALASLGVAVAGTAGLGVGYKLLKTVLRAKDPTLRNHYFNILKGASTGNSEMVLRNIRPLDKAMKEMEESGFSVTDEID